MASLYAPLTGAVSGAPLDLLGSIPPLPRDISSYNAKLRFACRFRAMPGGVISRPAYDQICNKLKNTLSAILSEEGRIDGVWLDLHGAMSAEGVSDVEGVLSSMVREIVGADSLLCASFDLHGNFSKQLASNVNITTAYRTAPHVDIPETRLRALYLLLSSLERGCAPKVEYIKVPLVVSGEMSSTAVEPCKTLYSEVLHTADGEKGILDASILVGYCWADEARSGCAVLVTYESGCEAEGSLHARRIASAIWTQRRGFCFPVPSGSIADCVNLAETHPHPCFISDSGDNPTAGGTGYMPDFLFYLLKKEMPLKTLLQGPVVDAATVQKCVEGYEGGTEVVVVVAGVEVRVTVLYACGEEVRYPFEYEGVTHETVMPGVAVVRLVEVPAVDVVLCCARKPLHYHADFAQLKLSLEAYQVVVIKIGYLVPDLAAIAASNLLALSPGAVYADLPTLQYKNLPRPFYPKDPDMTWDI